MSRTGDRWKLIDVKPSNRKDKRLAAVFVTTLSNSQQIVHFGSKNGSTFVDHQDITKRRNWIARHGAQIVGNRKQNKIWLHTPLSPSTLSRWILWEEPTLNAAIEKYKKKFNL